MGVGAGFACGRCQNKDDLSLERTFATWLLTPGSCTANIKKRNLADTKKRHLIKCIAFLSRLESNSTTVSTQLVKLYSPVYKRAITHWEKGEKRGKKRPHGQQAPEHKEQQNKGFTLHKVASTKQV